MQAPQIPIVSTVSGAWLEDDEATNPLYWAEHLRKTVRFADGVGVLPMTPALSCWRLAPVKHWVAAGARQHPNMRAEQVILSTSPHAQQSGACVEQYW
ncbi:MAG: hypothetical protein R2911_32030 [Caldilineaceae bacterium]